jgi:hypothetical protein
MIGGAIGSKLSTRSTKAGFASPLWLVTMNDTTANRAFNTTYLNSGSDGNVMVVEVLVGLYCNQTGGSATVIVEMNQTAQYLNVSMREIVGCVAGSSSPSDIFFGQELTFYVPWGFYYRLNTTSTDGIANVSKTGWFESVPPTGFGQMIAPEIMSIRRF